jgi:hypothetical protein
MRFVCVLGWMGIVAACGSGSSTAPSVLDGGATAVASDGGGSPADAGADTGPVLDNIGPELDAWQTGTPLPAPQADMGYAIHGDHVYIIGDSASLTDQGKTVRWATLASAGGVGDWKDGPSLPEARHQHAAVATNGYLYVLGGHGDGIKTLGVFISRLGDDGTPAAWETTTPLPKVLIQTSMVAHRGRLYVTGGWDEGTNGYKDVYVSVIGADGKLGPWTPSTPLPGLLFYHGSAIAKDRLWVVGGNSYGASKGIFWHAGIQQDGSLAPWKTEPLLSEDVDDPGVVIHHDRIYRVGGETASIEWASLGLPPSPWKRLQTQLPRTRQSQATFVHGDFLYVIGGYYVKAPSNYELTGDVIYAAFHKN